MTQIAQDSDLKLAKKQNKVMYRSTATFLEICSYISPGTAHEKWVKTYGAKLSKLWFPYEWFDTVPGMPPHEEWFSKLKNEMTLSEEAYRLVSESGRKKGCELLRTCFAFTTIWISSLFLKPWSQSEIPTRGWEWIFSKMRYLCRSLDEISPASYD